MAHQYKIPELGDVVFINYKGEYESWTVRDVFESLQLVDLENNRTGEIQDFSFLEVLTENKYTTTPNKHQEYVIVDNLYHPQFAKVFPVLEYCEDGAYVIVATPDNDVTMLGKNDFKWLKGEAWVCMYGDFYVYKVVHKKMLTYIGMGFGERRLHALNGRSHNKYLRKYAAMASVSFVAQNLSKKRALMIESTLYKRLRTPFNQTGEEGQMYLDKVISLLDTQMQAM